MENFRIHVMTAHVSPSHFIFKGETLVEQCVSHDGCEERLVEIGLNEVSKLSIIQVRKLIYNDFFGLPQGFGNTNVGGFWRKPIEIRPIIIREYSFEIDKIQYIGVNQKVVVTLFHKSLNVEKIVLKYLDDTDKTILYKCDPDQGAKYRTESSVKV